MQLKLADTVINDNIMTRNGSTRRPHETMNEADLETPTGTRNKRGLQHSTAAVPIIGTTSRSSVEVPRAGCFVSISFISSFCFFIRKYLSTRSPAPKIATRFSLFVGTLFIFRGAAASRDGNPSEDFGILHARWHIRGGFARWPEHVVVGRFQRNQ